MPAAFLTGERIALRTLEPGDLPFLQSLINNEELRPFLRVYWPLNGQAEREWLEGLYRSRDAFVFGIMIREGERLIGSCGLELGPAAHRSAKLGIAIQGAEHHGKGFGSEAMRLLLGYGFRTLNLHRIELEVYENNVRGIRCYESLGFVREGARREARWWEGRWWEVFHYGLLAREWERSGSGSRASAARAEAALRPRE